MLTRDELLVLTDKELLIRLMQECGEVIKAASKWALFGARPFALGVQYDNVADVREEMRQVIMIYEILSARF